MTESHSQIDSGPRICETCRKIDFGELHQKHKGHFYGSTHTEYPVLYSKGCIVCDLLLPVTLERRNHDALSVSSFSYSSFHRWGSLTLPYVHDSVTVFVGSAGGYADTVFCNKSGDTIEALCQSRIVQQVWDHVVARTWLQTCQRCHDQTCNESHPRFRT